MKLTVAITGASGASLALKFVDNIPENVEVFLVASKSAKIALKLEENISISNYFKSKKNLTTLNDSDISASIASGSFGIDKMIILPCSMNTLAKCSIGISDSLITRAFTVMLKQKKDIIIAPREMPYNTIILENMLKLSQLGVIIAPPSLGYYSSQQTLEDMEYFLIGKWFDLLGIDNNLYKRWE
ncbi:3-octaprenyl-4-hydroxybenzoate carboxy-lyase [Malaciobacter halophilus]|nr:UbiX family flavin prenyltransferase [Malaciobacter halophilus]RYA23964.1 3-octaprenyl-4-hydroxybenzoate carboxy-lyase [Malaciobacter halophilus]